MKIIKKIKSLSTKTLILRFVLGTGISLVFAYTWNNTSFLQTAVNQKRVLKPNEVQKIKENLDYLKNNIISNCKICIQCAYNGTTDTGNVQCIKINNGWSGWSGDTTDDAYPENDNASCRIKMQCD